MSYPKLPKVICHVDDHAEYGLVDISNLKTGLKAGDIVLSPGEFTINSSDKFKMFQFDEAARCPHQYGILGYRVFRFGKKPATISPVFSIPYPLP